MAKKRFWKDAWSILLAGSALTWGTASLSQTAASPAAPSDTEALSEIIVTAQHRSENLQDVPISIEAFGGQALEHLGVQSTEDLGNVTTNVTITLPQGAGNQPAITIRGIGLNENNSNDAGPNGMYVDEFYMSAPTSQSFALFDIDRLEVLKGPQGTLYGRNSAGGAINIITKKPTDELDGYVDASFGNFDTQKYSAAIGGPLADGIDGRIAFQHNYSEGYVFNTALGTHENGANDNSLRGSLLFKPTGDVRILLTTHFSEVDRLPDLYGHIGTFVPAPGPLSPTPALCSNGAIASLQCVDLYGQPTDPNPYHSASTIRDHLKVRDVGETVRVDFPLASLDATSITGFDYNYRFEPEDSDSSPFGQLKVNWQNDSREFTQEFRLHQGTAKYNWVAGLYALIENLHQAQQVDILLDFDRFFGPGAGDGVASEQTVNNKQITKAYAAFGQGEYQITDTLKAILGGRFTSEHQSMLFQSAVNVQQGGEGHFTPFVPYLNSENSVADTNFSWRAGLNFTPLPSLLFYGSVATGFKAGSFNGGFLSTAPDQAALQEAPVKPEKVITYEVGAKSQFLDKLITLNVDAFYNDYTNLQLFALINSPIGPVNLFTNAQKARTYGADLDLTVHNPIPNLTLTADVGYLQTKLTEYDAGSVAGIPNLTGNQLAYSPKFTSALTALYEIPLATGTSLDFEYSASFKSHQFFDPTNDPYITQGSYWLQNARVAFKINKWELSGYVHNLANKFYLADSFDGILPFGYVQPVLTPPRTYGVEARYRF
jgi:iron complex outermembrane recepter protein